MTSTIIKPYKPYTPTPQIQPAPEYTPVTVLETDMKPNAQGYVSLLNAKLVTGIVDYKLKKYLELHGNYMELHANSRSTRIHKDSLLLLKVIDRLYKRGLNVRQVKVFLANKDVKNAHVRTNTGQIKTNRMLSEALHYVEAVDTFTPSPDTTTVTNTLNTETIDQLKEIYTTESPNITRDMFLGNHKTFLKYPMPKTQGLSRFQLFYAFFNGDFPENTFFVCTQTKKVVQFTKNRIYDCHRNCGLTASRVFESWHIVHVPTITNDGNAIIEFI